MEIPTRLQHVLVVIAVSSCGGGGSGDANCPDGGSCDSGMHDAVVGDISHDSHDSAVACGTSAWATYGHDPQRTFATDACINGPLTMTWSYTPAPATGHTITGVFHALAQSDAAFLQWRGDDEMYLGSTAVDRVSTTGTRVWTWDSGTDSNFGNWGSLAFGDVVVQEDGLYFVDAMTGVIAHDLGVDWWGQTVPDPARLYLVQNAHIDGPGVFVGATDDTGTSIWQQNQYGMCRIDVSDTIAGLALDGGELFYAAAYNPGTGVTLPFSSGLYAFDGAAGTPHWHQPFTPTSAISAANGKVYGIESGMLEARNETDGMVAWMAPVMGSGAQAPVLANGMAIVAGASAITAFDAATGSMRWTHALAGAAAQPTSIEFTGGCAGLLPEGGATVTTMAAALGSQTLVVTASDGFHVLALADGSERWAGTASIAGSAHDPVLVGSTVYVVAGNALIALQSM